MILQLISQVRAVATTPSASAEVRASESTPEPSNDVLVRSDERHARPTRRVKALLRGLAATYGAA